MNTIAPKFRPLLDPGFVPAVLWNRAYQTAASKAGERRRVRFALERGDDQRWTFETWMLPDSQDFRSINQRYAERLLKSLLWAWGAPRVRIAGAEEIVPALASIYSSQGVRAFDAAFMGEDCFRRPFLIEAAPYDALEASPLPAISERPDLSGCRIGFDLGGSDRKCAALIDGVVVHSEEVKWSPYFEKDPMYHLSGIQDSLERAARHLPRVDAIGGSAAGIYIDNEPRVGSLFRGIGREDFEQHIRPLFRQLAANWGEVPFQVANDGDVTAIAGAMVIEDNAVLGISMGTSQAGGYISPLGHLTGWLNELAFVPIDFRENAPLDEWSGDGGCGVQYFSQQAVGRLLPASGIQVDSASALPERLELVQDKLNAGDERAAKIYQTIGTYFGYAIAHYADFYNIRHLLVLGRVSSGEGGDHILEEARRVLDNEFPELAETLLFQTPDEATKRHGQAIAAASLPKINP